MLEFRILEVLAKSGLSRTDFTHSLGVSNAVLSHISSGRNKASIDLVLNILTRYPDISAEWLLLGEGKMLKKDAARLDEELTQTLLSEIRSIQSTLQSGLDKVNALEKRIIEINSNSI